MDLKITNKINFFELNDFVKKIWKKNFHNTNMLYYNYLINQNFSNNNDNNILVGYKEKKISALICNINLFLSGYRVGSLINFYSLKDDNYSFLSAKLLKACMTNYDILFNSAPRKTFSDKLIKNNNWFSVKNYYTEILLNKSLIAKSLEREFVFNFTKIKNEHINFINGLKDFIYYDKSINYYKWRFEGINIFCKKQIFFVEFRINNKLKALFIIELKNNNAILHEFYSSLDDLEISLVYLIKYLNREHSITRLYLFLHKSMFDFFKELKINILIEKTHFFYFKKNNELLKNELKEKFMVFPTDSDGFLYL